LAKFSDLDIFGNYQTSGFAQQDEPGGFEKLRVSVDPGAAFGFQTTEMSLVLR
jgi:replicative DNA helicase